MKLPQLAFTGLTLCALTTAGVQAETAHLVRDINPSDSPYDGGSFNPQVLAPAGERVVFSGYEENTPELWTSDGTVNGTELLVSSCCAGLIGTTGKLTFWAGEELWRSDGAPAGTFSLGPLVWDPNQANQTAQLGDLLFFLRSSGSSWNVWQTDGTLAGTRKAADVPARWLIAAGGRVFAVTTDEVWRIEPGKPAAFVKKMTTIQRPLAAGARLLLVVNDGTEEELWGSDGTAAGTRQLTQFTNTYPFFDAPPVFLSRGTHLYFVAAEQGTGHELWVSDGTPAGTRRITNFAYDFPFNERYLKATFQEIGNRVVFAAGDGPEAAERPQIWVTDGRPESTTKLMDHPCPLDVYGCTAAGDRYAPFEMVRAGDRVLFPAVDAAHGVELWATDGTPGGTRLLKDLCPGSCGSVPAFIPASPSTTEAFLAARNGQEHYLWRTDGTAAGTRKLHRDAMKLGDVLRPFLVVAGNQVFLKTGDETGGNLRVLREEELRPLTFPVWVHDGSDPQAFSRQGSRVYFSADEGTGRRLWQTLGTAETTRPDPVLDDLRTDETLVSAGSTVYLVQEDALSKLTESGLEHISALQIGTSSYLPSVASLGSLLYFRLAYEGSAEIWRTNGTSAGTERLTLPAAVGTPGAVATSVDRLYFLASPDGQRTHLWISDGTTAGTRELTTFQRFEGASGFNAQGTFPLIRAGNLDYFVTFLEVFDGDSYSLWRTDGTAAGTRKVQLSTGRVLLHPEEMIEHGGALYLLGEDAEDNTLVLWRVDGDTAVRLRSFDRRPDELTLFRLAVAGGRVLFEMQDIEHGRELWSTDGTVQGTRLLREIAAGSLSARVSGLVSAGGRAFFTAWDEDHGTELWQTDGTQAGTRLVHDIAPGPAPSNPTGLTVLGGQLLFAADDGLTGRELWALPLAGSGGCQPSATTLCLQGGRYRVAVSWRDFQRHSGQGTAVGLTSDTGYFWFFDAANAELIVKVLDGQGLNGHVWVFFGALSNVEYVLTVTDTQTGLTRRYMNPAGQLASIGDTEGFGPLGAHSAAPDLRSIVPPSPSALVSGRTVPAAATGTCQAGPQRLCLNGGRFAVEASWKDFQGNTGRGTAVPLTADTGWFWFFAPTNVEVMLKVLDGTPLNGKFWVFYGALSNVEYTLTVTDTQTGAVKEYRNPSGRFASVADTGAF